MSSRTGILAIIILTGLLSVTSAWSGQEEEQGLLVNPSFEEGEISPGVMFPGWNGYSTGKSLFVLTSEARRTGKYCAKFVAQKRGSQFQGLTQGIAVDASRKYSFSVQVLNSMDAPLKGTAYGQLVIEWLGADGTEIDRVWTDRWDGRLSRKRWKKYYVRKVSPPRNAVSAIIGIHLFEGKNGGRGAVYIDDVTVVEY